MAQLGFVSIVGAGPGDPELITRRGQDRLRNAEVVVYDRLLDPRLLEDVPPDAERIFAGKAAGSAALSQRAIETVLVERARAGKRVVRLKGGDPFLFGRGGEEVEALAAAGIDYDVVPGITSAIAGPGSAGIPVTHRELASMLTIVTAHEDPAKHNTAVDWDWVARASGTLVVLMGLERLDSICRRLLAAGRDPETPAAVVSSATWPQQRSVLGALSEIADEASRGNLQSPAIIVVGEVARFPQIVAELGRSHLETAV